MLKSKEIYCDWHMLVGYGTQITVLQGLFGALFSVFSQRIRRIDVSSKIMITAE